MKPEERRFPVAIDMKGRPLHPGCLPRGALATRGTLREEEARVAPCCACRQPIATVRPV